MFISMGARRAPHRLITFTLSLNLLLALVLEMCVFNANAASKMSSSDVVYEDNEFAEFEEFDEDEPQVAARVPDISSQSQRPSEDPAFQRPPLKQQDDMDDDSEAVVEDEDDDIFENVKDNSEERTEQNKGKKSEGLKFTKVPMHLRSNWESYYLEILMAAGIIVYFINFITGRSKNQRLADAWLDSNRELLEANFALVGDDGKKEIENHGLVKETESVFTLWCSGRTSVEGLLVELKLIKRHDLLSTITRLVRPATDQIIFKVHLNQDTMDNYVFCIATKKTALKYAKDMADIVTFCPDRKSAEKYDINADKFVMMNEVGEVPSVLIDSKVVSVMSKYEDYIDYVHISDQYSGSRLPDETQIIKLPEVKKILVFAFNCSPSKGKTTVESMEGLRALTQLVFYMVDKVKRFRLSKEGRSKSDKNRQRVEEIFLKATHSQRQEAAQIKREERRRVDKERMMAEEDPDKQRRWEEKEYKRDMKRKTPKMKQLKVKSM